MFNFAGGGRDARVYLDPTTGNLMTKPPQP
jgi:hypothetical protein